MIATTQSDCLFRMDVVPYTLLNYITGSVVKPIDQWYLTPYIYIYIYIVSRSKCQVRPHEKNYGSV
jgi:hypothetical protein